MSPGGYPPHPIWFPLDVGCAHAGVTRRSGVSGTGDGRATPVVGTGAQGMLFDEDGTLLSDEVGFRGPTACAVAGITYRQLDYWARTGLVEPTIRSASG